MDFVAGRPRLDHPRDRRVRDRQTQSLERHDGGAAGRALTDRRHLDRASEDGFASSAPPVATTDSTASIASTTSARR
jgi:hypothetical protein